MRAPHVGEVSVRRAGAERDRPPRGGFGARLKFRRSLPCGAAGGCAGPRLLTGRVRCSASLPAPEPREAAGAVTRVALCVLGEPLS